MFAPVTSRTVSEEVVLVHASRKRVDQRVLRVTRSGLSRGWGEELECDAVGVAKAQPGAVVGVDDAAVFDAEFVQFGLPRLEFRTVRAAEADMVETGLELAESSTF